MVVLILSLAKSETNLITHSDSKLNACPLITGSVDLPLNFMGGCMVIQLSSIGGQ